MRLFSFFSIVFLLFLFRIAFSYQKQVFQPNSMRWRWPTQAPTAAELCVVSFLLILILSLAWRPQRIENTQFPGCGNIMTQTVFCVELNPFKNGVDWILFSLWRHSTIVNSKRTLSVSERNKHKVCELQNIKLCVNCRSSHSSQFYSYFNYRRVLFTAIYILNWRDNK